MAERAVTVQAVRAGRAASSPTRATVVRFERCCAEGRVEELGRGQQTGDGWEAGMMKSLPNAPVSVGISKTWHCARMSTGISSVLKSDLVVPGQTCQCADTSDLRENERQRKPTCR
jgi:hypothetical protein